MAADPPPPITGNTATLINDIFSKGTTPAVNALSDFIGALADIGAADGAIISLVESLAPNDPNSTSSLQLALKAISTQISQSFHQLGQDLGAAQILTRNTTISNNIFSATGSYPIL
jgi:hypothetical protein